MDVYSTVFKWRYPNWAASTGSVYSETFLLGTYLWRLFMFPQGNKTESLSLYLECAEARDLTPALSPKTRFKVVLLNHLDPAKNFSKETSHTYTPAEHDWGFTSLLPLEDIRREGSGFVAPDGSITVEAHITLDLTRKERRRLTQEGHGYCTVQITTDHDCPQQAGHSLGLVDDPSVDPAVHPGCAVFRLAKNTAFPALQDMVAERFGVPPDHQRYWSTEVGQDEGRCPGARRLQRIVFPGQDVAPRMMLWDIRTLKEPMQEGVKKDSGFTLRLYLETPVPPGTPFCTPPGVNDVFLLVKFYDPLKEEIRLLSAACYPKTMKVSDLMAQVGKREGLSRGHVARMEAFREVGGRDALRCDPVCHRDTLASANLMTGDVVITQVLPGEKQGRKCRFSTVDQYLLYMRHLWTVNLRKLRDASGSGTTLYMDKHMDYDQVTQCIARHLGLVTPSRLRLTRYDGLTEGPQQDPIPWHGVSRLEDMMRHAHHINEILYYEVLDVPLQELEARQQQQQADKGSPQGEASGSGLATASSLEPELESDVCDTHAIAKDETSACDSDIRTVTGGLEGLDLDRPNVPEVSQEGDQDKEPHNCTGLHPTLPPDPPGALESQALTMIHTGQYDDGGQSSGAVAPAAPPHPKSALFALDLSLYECPITQELMSDPVMASDGYSYERAAIEMWLSTRNTSPMTNVELPNKNMLTNWALKSAIMEYRRRIGG